MSNRKTANSISATPDDAAGGYRRSQTAPRRRGGSGGGQRLIGVNLILVVLVAGLVLAGWFIANQHQQLTAESAALDDAEARLKVLEDRLRTTDEAMTESGQETSEQINFWESEIRKLWAVSNERNKKWIQDNQKAIESQKKAMDDVLASNRSLSAAVGRHESAFKQQQDIIDQLTGLELQIQQLVNSQRELITSVNEVQRTVTTLAARVGDNEQAVAAIDSWRVQLNSRLTAMERRLDNLSVSPAL